MRTFTHIAAVVVWYNPTEQQSAYIRHYAPAVERVYIVDNSAADNTRLAQPIANAVYLPNHTNHGIATALNTGFEQAIADGAKWILSFDQDSQIDADTLREYIRLCEACEIPNVGLFAPYPFYGNDLLNSNTVYEKRDTVITSGSLMSADTYRQVGRFRDEFFIDLVDDDYCARIKRLGKEVILVNPIVMEHRLGNGFVEVPILHHRFIEHNALRHYYIVRNTLFMQRDYPEQRAFYRKQIRKRIKRLLLYDWHDKWNKIKQCVRAYRDYKSSPKRTASGL